MIAVWAGPEGPEPGGGDSPPHLNAGALDAHVSRPLPLQRLVVAADAIERACGLGEIAAALVDSGVSAVSGTGAVVTLLDGAGTHLQLAASSGYDPNYLAPWHRFPLSVDVPLTEAVRTGRTVVVASVEEFGRRYPHVELPDHRPHALVAVPLHGGAGIVGGWGIRLDTDVDPPIDGVLTAAVSSEYLANVAAARVSRSATEAALRERVDQLQHALNSRVVIEQAKGILSERHGVTPAHAFERLRRHARNSSRHLHVIAAAVVAGDIDPMASGDDADHAHGAG